MKSKHAKWEPSKSSVICSRHFKPTDFESRFYSLPGQSLQFSQIKQRRLWSLCLSNCSPCQRRRNNCFQTVKEKGEKFLGETLTICVFQFCVTMIDFEVDNRLLNTCPTLCLQIIKEAIGSFKQESSTSTYSPSLSTSSHVAEKEHEGNGSDTSLLQQETSQESPYSPLNQKSFNVWRSTNPWKVYQANRQSCFRQIKVLNFNLKVRTDSLGTK